MRNHKFRLSDMIPNAWFHKLKEIGGGRARSSNIQTSFNSKKNHRQPPSKQRQSPMPPPPPPPSRSRKSYHFPRELEFNDGFCINSPPPSPPLLPPLLPLPQPARKSLKQQKPGRRRTSSRTSSTVKLLSSSSVSCSCHTTAESIWMKSDSPPEFSTSPSNDTSPEPEPEPEIRTDKIAVAESESFDRDIVIDISSNYSNNAVVVGAFDSLSDLDLPPIITKRKKKNTKQRTTTSPIKKIPTNLTGGGGGVRLRIHSPKISHRKIGGRKSTSSRRSLSDSLAIMKSSYDPQKDFRESMVEMIVENNIRASKDLEDLLACYLCLNADEYHDLIIKVFKQIWFDLTELVSPIS